MDETPPPIEGLPASGAAHEHARKRLQRTGQKLAQVAHRLRSNSTRKKVPEPGREPLALDADAIRKDAKALQGTLACSAS